MYDSYMLQQNPYNRYATVSLANAPISQFQSGGQIVRVNGYQGAQAYQMGANAAAVLFDVNEDIFYKKNHRRSGICKHRNLQPVYPHRGRLFLSVP